MKFKGRFSRRKLLCPWGLKLLFQCESCPGLFPLQDIKHDSHTCPCAITGAGERLHQSCFPSTVLREVLGGWEVTPGPEEIAYLVH